MRVQADSSSSAAMSDVFEELEPAPTDPAEEVDPRRSAISPPPSSSSPDEAEANLAMGEQLCQSQQKFPLCLPPGCFNIQLNQDRDVHAD